MSRYESASHVFYRCQYHIVWTPKYRFRVLKGKIAKEVYRSIYVFCSMKKCKVVELNVQIDHVHLVVRTPPSLSVSDLMGVLKDRTAIRLFNKFSYLRKKKLWGNHFWQRGYSDCAVCCAGMGRKPVSVFYGGGVWCQWKFSIAVWVSDEPDGI